MADCRFIIATAFAFLGTDAFYRVRQSQKWERGVSEQMFWILCCTITVLLPLLYLKPNNFFRLVWVCHSIRKNIRFCTTVCNSQIQFELLNFIFFWFYIVLYFEFLILYFWFYISILYFYLCIFNFIFNFNFLILYF